MMSPSPLLDAEKAVCLPYSLSFSQEKDLFYLIFGSGLASPTLGDKAPTSTGDKACISSASLV